MILDLELADEIYEKLNVLAKERGISVKEIIRWALGDYTLYNRTSSAPVPLTSFAAGPPLLGESTTNMIKMVERIVKLTAIKGTFKCSNCTMPLTIEDINQGKCSNCQADI